MLASKGGYHNSMKLLLINNADPNRQNTVSRGDGYEVVHTVEERRCLLALWVFRVTF